MLLSPPSRIYLLSLVGPKLSQLRACRFCSLYGMLIHSVLARALRRRKGEGNEDSVGRESGDRGS